VVDLGFRRIDVLGLVVAQGAPAEGHGTAAAVADGEHEAVAEQVPGAFIAVSYGFDGNQGVQGLFVDVTHERIALGGGA